MYLLDTNALSELLKKRPKPQFLARLRLHPAEMFFTSSICVMELRHESRRCEDHSVFWQRITHEVLSRVTVLDFGVPEALIAGDVLAHLTRRGALIGVEDLLIGATPLGTSPRWRWSRVLPQVLASALTRRLRGADRVVSAPAQGRSWG
jgi:predicted nucleic acid-binding protein